MRMKDENKKAAISKAIIGLINEIGFANISMSKIAKATGLSAATLYVYYENKEDMFRKVLSGREKANDRGMQQEYLSKGECTGGSQKTM